MIFGYVRKFSDISRVVAAGGNILVRIDGKERVGQVESATLYSAGYCQRSTVTVRFPGSGSVTVAIDDVVEDDRGGVAHV